MKTNTRRLTESAMLLALALVLELVSKAVIPNMPFGGQITLASMLPVVLISYRHGIKWGLVSSFCYALIEMFVGMKNVTAAFQPGTFGDGVMVLNGLAMCVLDYLLAFVALGLGGCFRERISKPGTALMCGSLVALGLRYLCHIVSGAILYGSWAQWFFTQEGFPGWGASLAESLNPGLLAWVYSLVYNGTFMVPEILLTAVVSVLIARVPGIVSKIS